MILAARDPVSLAHPAGVNLKPQALWLASIVIPFCGHASAETCNAPGLAPGFCDSDGDLIADSPGDKSQWIDPDPIVLADVPTTDMQARAERATPFLRYLEKATGRKVTYFVARDLSDLLAAFKAQRVHLLILNTGSVEPTVRCNGFVPIAQPVDAAGNLGGYRMEIVVPANSAIKTARDLKGRKITFVDEHSNSGYKTPRTILAKEFGLEAGKDYSFEFSGRQDNSIMGIANGVYEAAAVASDLHENLVRDKLLNAAAVRIIYTSRTFPHSPWGVGHRLNPALVTRLRSAFLSYTGSVGALSGNSRFRAASYKADWEFMRELSAASGKPSGCN